MFFSQKEYIAGISAKRIRDLLRELSAFSWQSEERIAHFLKDSIQVGHRVTQELVTRQWLVPCEEGYALTEVGRQGAAARIGVPLSRKKAKGLLKDVLSRVKAWNKMKGTPLVITDVYVYGSYLRDVAWLGDIDIAVKYERTDHYSMDRQRQEQFAQAHGLPLSTGQRDPRFFLDMSLFRFVKKGQATISLCHWSSLEQLSCPYKVVFNKPLSSKANFKNVPDVEESNGDSEIYVISPFPKEPLPRIRGLDKSTLPSTEDAHRR